MTEEERELLNMKMKETGIRNMGAYLRKMSLNGMIFVVDMTSLKSINNKMTGISTNINQISKKVNMTNSIHIQDIEELQNGVDEIWQLLRSIQSVLQLG